VHHLGAWGTDATLLAFLLGVERAPFGAVVDTVFLDDEAAVFTGAFAASFVSKEISAAFRAGGEAVRFGFGRGFVTGFLIGVGCPGIAG